jgi:hypothetical protein
MSLRKQIPIYLRQAAVSLSLSCALTTVHTIQYYSRHYSLRARNRKLVIDMGSWKEGEVDLLLEFVKEKHFADRKSVTIPPLLLISKKKDFKGASVKVQTRTDEQCHEKWKRVCFLCIFFCFIDLVVAFSYAKRILLSKTGLLSPRLHGTPILEYKFALLMTRQGGNNI